MAVVRFVPRRVLLIYPSTLSLSLSVPLCAALSVVLEWRSRRFRQIYVDELDSDDNGQAP